MTERRERASGASGGMVGWTAAFGRRGRAVLRLRTRHVSGVIPTSLFVDRRGQIVVAGLTRAENGSYYTLLARLRG